MPGELNSPRRDTEDKMARREKKKTRPVIGSVRELIEHFFDIDTSVEEAHGLLNVIATGPSHHSLPGIGSVNRSDRVKIVKFLCTVGDEVEIHPTLDIEGEGEHDLSIAYRQLRRRARVVLVRHALPALDAFNFDDGPFEGESADETVCRFFAKNRHTHCDIRHNPQDLDKLRRFFGPPRGWFDPSGFCANFYLALAHLGLTDILVDRRDIGAIPVLSQLLGEFKWAGTDIKGLMRRPEPRTVKLPDDWEETADYNQEGLVWLESGLPRRDVDYAVHAVDYHTQRAGFVLANASPHLHPHAPEEDVEIASALAALCAMASHLLHTALRGI